jgi:hypothetical protein
MNPTDPTTGPERVDYFASACLTLESPTAKMPAVQPAAGTPRHEARPRPSLLATNLHRYGCGCRLLRHVVEYEPVADDIRGMVAAEWDQELADANLTPPVDTPAGPDTWWVRLGRWTLAVTRNPQGGAR